MNARILPALCLSLLLSGLLCGCAVESGAQLAASFDAGVAAYDAGDKQRAFDIWSGISDQDLAAMRNMAMMLRRGDGVKQDRPAAAALYRRAAEAGLPTAQADLADMLLKGEVGAPNVKAALPLLQAAAAQGHPIAQFSLGRLYETGVDGLLTADLELARQLYADAAARGMKDAEARLQIIGPPKPTTPPGAALPLPTRATAGTG
jgi:hypothetical protein